MMTPPERPEHIRRFGFILGGMFTLLGVLSWVLHLWIPWPVLLIPGVSVLTIALLNLPLLRHIYKGWMTFARAMAWFQTRLILGLFFYLMLTPLAFIMRLFGRDSMQLKRKSSDTFWDSRDSTPTEPERYRKQY
jgi:hypothetical protein